MGKLKSYSLELEKSNTELTQFTSIASHDLQEPPRKVIIFGDRLKEKTESLDEVSRDYINPMQKSTLRMQILIDNLLELSRVSTKTEPFERHNLTMICKESLISLEDRMEKSQG